MRIGIDLDNTIIDYTKAFNNYISLNKIINNSVLNIHNKILDKSILKSNIIKKKNGDLIWQKIQGQIYGKNINMANIYLGFKRFLFFSKLRNIELFIVSHKTKFGHFDKSKTPLRTSALNFLSKNGLFNYSKYGLKKNNIFFADNRDEKINIINSLNLDFFIDDLPEVLLHKKFNKQTKKILINNHCANKKDIFMYVTNWGEINNFFFKKNSKQEIIKILKQLNIKNPKKVEAIRGGINSKVFKIYKKKQNICLKIYPLSQDHRERCMNEFNAFHYLNKNKIFKTPKSLAVDNDLKIATYSWIDGEKTKSLNKKNIKYLLSFIKDLKNLSLKTKITKFNLASEASVNLNRIYEYNKNRILKLKKNNLNYMELNNHIDQIDKLNKKNNLKLIKFINKNSIKITLPKKNLILSPSDISLRNIIKNNNNDFYIDFEYFGWDDPCKTLSDIIWHPSMKINNENYKKIIFEFNKLFSDDKYFKNRLNFTFNLYGVRWSLILLNIFSKYYPSNFKKLDTSTKNKLLKQLNKSKKIIANVIDDKYKSKYLYYESI